MNGWKQHVHVSKEELTSPTVAIEAVFLMAVVDAWENHSVAVVDMHNVSHVQFHREMVEN